MKSKNLLMTLAVLIIALSLEAQVIGTYTDSRDGKVYKTVTIGTQTWMAENLAYKSPTGCLAYDNSLANANKYGYLYNWETANKMCPTGWHLPDKAEWLVLINYLGGTAAAQSKLLAQNSNGFSAKTGGEAMGSEDFMYLDMNGYWWSSTENNDGDKASRIAMGIKMLEISVFEQDKNDAYSVRCIKDSNDLPSGSIIQNNADTAKQNLTVITNPTTTTNVQQTNVNTADIVEKSFTDTRDGNVYHTVKIGTQVWMTNNLMATEYNDGTPITLITDNSLWQNATEGAYSWYDNKEKNKSTYGALYNWYAVNTKELCPIGWHVPSFNEFGTLIISLGNQSGDKLKEAGKKHWLSENESTNSSGFTALPGGSRNWSGNFSGLQKIGNWWSSTEQKEKVAFSLYIYYSKSEAENSTGGKTEGMSVRCIKD